MRRRLVKALITAILLSIFCMWPVRAQNIDDIIRMEQDMLKKDKEFKQKKRYAMAPLNVRRKPNSKSKVIKGLNYNQKVYVKPYNTKWVELVNKKGKHIGYVREKYLSKKQMKSRDYEIPEYSGMKSWMDYRKITDTESPQWKLQQEYAETGSYGLRTVDGRYCVAIGYAFEPKIGQYFDLVLRNGTVIPCIISDIKAHADTTDDMYTTDTDCYSEFVVDGESLSNKAHPHGDISDVNKDWDSPVEYIKIYTKKNVLEE